MQPAPQKNMQAVMLGQRGGYKRAEHLTAEQRSAISRHAARLRWHPQEAQEITYLVTQALKGKQLPLV